MPHGSQVRLLFCCPFHVKPKLLFSDVKLDRCVRRQSAHWKHMADWSPWSSWLKHSKWHWWNNSTISPGAAASTGVEIGWGEEDVGSGPYSGEQKGRRICRVLTSSWGLKVLPFDLVCLGGLGFYIVIAEARNTLYCSTLFLMCTCK